MPDFTASVDSLASNILRNQASRKSDFGLIGGLGQGMPEFLAMLLRPDKEKLHAVNYFAQVGASCT